MRGRGLKLDVKVDNPLFSKVAPHAGAWIETPSSVTAVDPLEGRPPCEGVD